MPSLKITICGATSGSSTQHAYVKSSSVDSADDDETSNATTNVKLSTSASSKVTTRRSAANANNLSSLVGGQVGRASPSSFSNSSTSSSGSSKHDDTAGGQSSGEQSSGKSAPSLRRKLRSHTRQQQGAETPVNELTETDEMTADENNKTPTPPLDVDASSDATPQITRNKRRYRRGATPSQTTEPAVLTDFTSFQTITTKASSDGLEPVTTSHTETHAAVALVLDTTLNDKDNSKSESHALGDLSVNSGGSESAETTLLVETTASVDEVISGANELVGATGTSSTNPPISNCIKKFVEIRNEVNELCFISLVY